MVGWHHGFNGHELGQTPRDGEGQGGLILVFLILSFKPAFSGFFFFPMKLN